MKKFSILAGILALILCWGGVAAAHQTLGAHIKCQDSFLFLVDYSGSMMMTHKVFKEEKIDVAKQAMAKINAKLPALAYNAGLFTFAPKSTVVAAGAWDRAALNKGIWSLKNGQAIYSRMTPMGNDFAAQASAISALPGKTAIVLLSDGEANLGRDPVAGAQAIYAANPNATIHIVSLADTKKGAAVLQKIAALKPGSVLVDATEIVAVEELADQFVQKVFCFEASQAKDILTLRAVHFAVGKYNLDKVATATLDQYAAVLKTRPEERISIVGWADVTGQKKANQTLSENRAKAVKNYLEKAGVKNKIIVDDGRGVSYYYDNNTPAGRFMNRRAEVNIISP
ncbi:MAG: OmpA family protein [Deltaproteobacteria bacterium]|jgi:OOP family OmpA-OmpF porin|nr:OmpA family protein [Deltaproteobacteria bacterium]